MPPDKIAGTSAGVHTTAVLEVDVLHPLDVVVSKEVDVVERPVARKQLPGQAAQGAAAGSEFVLAAPQGRDKGVQPTLIVDLLPHPDARHVGRADRGILERPAPAPVAMSGAIRCRASFLVTRSPVWLLDRNVRKPLTVEAVCPDVVFDTVWRGTLGTVRVRATVVEHVARDSDPCRVIPRTSGNAGRPQDPQHGRRRRGHTPRVVPGNDRTSGFKTFAGLQNGVTAASRSNCQDVRRESQSVVVGRTGRA